MYIYERNRLCELVFSGEGRGRIIRGGSAWRVKSFRMPILFHQFKIETPFQMHLKKKTVSLSNS